MGCLFEPYTKLVLIHTVLVISKDQSDIREGTSAKTQYLEKAMQQQRDLRYNEV